MAHARPPLDNDVSESPAKRARTEKQGDTTFVLQDRPFFCAQIASFLDRATLCVMRVVAARFAVWLKPDAPYSPRDVIEDMVAHGHADYLFTLSCQMNNWWSRDCLSRALHVSDDDVALLCTQDEKTLECLWQRLALLCAPASPLVVQQLVHDMTALLSPPYAATLCVAIRAFLLSAPQHIGALCEEAHIKRETGTFERILCECVVSAQFLKAHKPSFYPYLMTHVRSVPYLIWTAVRVLLVCIELAEHDPAFAIRYLREGAATLLRNKMLYEKRGLTRRLMPRLLVGAAIRAAVVFRDEQDWAFLVAHWFPLICAHTVGSRLRWASRREWYYLLPAQHERVMAAIQGPVPPPVYIGDPIDRWCIMALTDAQDRYSSDEDSDDD